MLSIATSVSGRQRSRALMAHPVRCLKNKFLSGDRSVRHGTGMVISVLNIAHL
jgi:hypothetical protein